MTSQATVTGLIDGPSLTAPVHQRARSAGEAPLSAAPAGRSGWGEAHPAAVRRAALETIAYADVFDYPLTGAEVHRYLAGIAASAREVEAALRAASLGGPLVRRGDLYALRGRESGFDLRRRRADAARRLWPDALRYGRIVARLPFVRLVAITGALAMDNVDPGDDVDQLIVTAPRRLWLCRALVIAVVRLAAARGTTLCPNYFLSERALVLADRNLFTAHELTQMIPIAGLSLDRRLRRLNAWTARFLPNAAGPPPRAVGHGLGAAASRAGHRSGERALGLRAFDGIERWEMRRKIRKFGRWPPADEAAFGPDWCKGHFDGHAERVLAAFAGRLEALGLARP